MEKFDLTVVGGGPGGYVAAIRASQLGARTALVEQGALGGTCLNRGCIPTKALLRSAEVLDLLRDARSFGLQADGVAPDFPSLFARKDRVVKQLRSGVEFLLKSRQVTVLAGHGSLVGEGRVRVESEGREEIIESPHIVIATGSVPARVPIPGADGPAVITSDQALELEQVPGRVAIIGGGAIGVEFGQIFASLGSKVTILEMLPHLLPLEDEEIAAELAKSLKKRGIAGHASTRVSGIRDSDGAKVVSFSTEKGDQQLAVDLVLLAVGRVPNLEGLGLEAAGVKVERRAIVVNQRMETGVPGLYACGDAVGGIMLAHLASVEGKVAVENALGHSSTISYRAVPNCIYTSPEVSSVGLTEAKAIEAGHRVRVGRFFFRAAGKAVAMGEREGLVKLVADHDSGVILGVQMVGPHVTDLIAEATLAVAHNLTAHQLGSTIHAHPTLAEPLMEAAEDALGQAIRK